MKLKAIVLPVFLMGISVSVKAQKHAHTEAYDSGFTNKAEAKNKMVNGKKEGKWVEEFKNTGDTTKPIYRLAVYKSGKLNGIARYYYANGTEYEEEAYTNGTRNGVTKEFDSRKHLVKETPYINDTINGVVKDFNADGTLKKETLYYKGKEGISKSH